jgi:hypothetical protein
MGIEQIDQSILKKLKREDVGKTLASLTQFMTNATWLGLNNRYSKDTIKTISAEVEIGTIVSPSQLSELIAASCLLHCSDGWSYLGRAICALLRGDPHRARHLAYYAELRAASSLLATEAVGVFHTEHFAITGPKKAAELGTRKGTHTFAWDCLEFWSAQPSSANLFSQIIRPYGLSLESWCSPLGGASTFAPHARDWFKQWGMDLRIFHDDHRVRNVSSYEPDGLPQIWTLDGYSVINFVKDLWEALEPSPTCSFDTIDQHILRISLEKHFTAVTGKQAAKARPRFRKFVAPVVEHQGLSEAINKRWLQFMNREAGPRDLDIFKFSQKLPDDMAFSAFAVMSRAALLLRAASGSTSRLFLEANHAIESYKFWWEKFGLARGLWQGKKDASELQDLYLDIRESLTDIASFQTRHSKSDQTFFRLGEDVSKAVITLGSCERIALWGMAP